MTPPARSERGASLVEMVVAVAVLAAASAIIISFLVSSWKATERLEAESRNLDELRVAMARVEREFRSAECISQPPPDPDGDPVAGSVLEFTTRADGGTTAVTYTVADGTLFREEGTGGALVPVATGLVGGTEAFTYTETPRRSVVVRLTLSADGDKPRSLETVVAGRNAWRNC